MAAIILAIVQLFGPLALEWFQKWLESRLKKAAESLPSVAYFRTEADAAEALFDQAIANEWWFNVRARRRLRNAKAHVLAGEPGKIATWIHPLAAGDLS